MHSEGDGNHWGNHEAVGEEGPVRAWGPRPGGGRTRKGLGPEVEAGIALPLKWGGENPTGVRLQLGVASRLFNVGGRVWL